MPKVDKRAFAARFAARRQKVGLSQPMVAKAVGMSQQGVNNIEHATSARPRLIIELANVLLTTPEWLLFGIGPEEVRPIDPVDQAKTLINQIEPDRLGAALQYLKTLKDGDERAA